MKKRVIRRTQRYRVHLEVAEMNGQRVTDTFVTDLSSLGARIEAASPLAARKHVELTLRRSAQEALDLSGQVVWIRPLLTNPGRFQMGLNFFSPRWDIDRLGRQGQL